MRLAFLLLVLLSPAFAAMGQPVLQDEIEIGGMYLNYGSGISDWRSLVVRTQFVRGPRMVWSGEAVAEERFGEPSFAYKIQHQADFGAWITRVSGRTSNGGFYNPRYRFDAMVGRKILPQRQLILTVGGFHREVRDGHRDTGVNAESQWYLRSWLIAQAGLRFQVSNPGQAVSRYQDFAMTIGRYGRALVVLAGGFGTEAYQIIDPLVIYTDFSSYGVRMTYRQWLTRGTGFSLTGSFYSNPFYQRKGVELSFFFGFNERVR
jgi:YaiO family outer membrane protein